MRRYRIVSNGINFRIQWLGKTFFQRRPKWYWLYKETYNGLYIVVCTTIENARNEIAEAKKYDKAQRQGYLPI